MPFIGLSKPKQQAVSEALRVGDTLPASEEFTSSAPYGVIAFLRHVGCPFAENTVKQLRNWADNHDNAAVFIVSHGDAESTESWLMSIGGLGKLKLVIDENRETYGRWGIGYSNLWHFSGLSSLVGVIALLMKGIRNRNACGTRWQRSAMFLVDDKNILWAHNAKSAEELLLPAESILQ